MINFADRVVALRSNKDSRRGAFYMRPRKYAPPRTGTGGYGIRPYEIFFAHKGKNSTIFIISYLFFII